jgi:REP element-mobilizing transposase RayT
MQDYRLMARRRRLISNQGVYHVYNRAELGQPIFETDAAKQVMMEVVLAVAHRFAWQLHAYAIMTNHFHLVVTTPRGNLSEGMHALQSAFANKHKTFRGSVGHVFQSRFGCAHYPAGALTAGKIDYVHLNPVRAGIVSLEELGDYRWTSYRLIRRPHQRGIVTVGQALPAFYGLRDDSAGWDAYEERLRFVLATEERAATDEELFGLVRKEKAGRRTDCTGIPQVAGKSRELLRQEEFLRWEDAFRAELTALGHTEAELDIRPYGQPWKISLARKLRDEHGASSAWLAIRMRYSSASFLRKLLSEN